ncbi:class I SAM-dependent methyltransferase [Cohnella rhizosphaerae]|uniref:class I SAM-dependent methyltransferase n=1 Tax=Cohnella rhizosphaerae TaxID=1457232 RepID=UPI0030B8D3A7
MGLFDEESRAFARKFMENPGQVGSLVPSSVRLARAMAREIDWGKARAVAELGSGTGAITREIARRREPGTSVYLFEKDAAMRRRLRERFPNFRCFSDAAGMADTLRRDGSGGLDAIVSGLPFFNFPQAAAGPAARTDRRFAEAGRPVRSLPVFAPDARTAGPAARYPAHPLRAA